MFSFFRKKKKVQEKSFFKTKEEEFCFDESKFKKDVTKEDIDVDKLISNLSYFFVNKYDSTITHRKFNSFFICRNMSRDLTYIAIFFNRIKVFTKKIHREPIFSDRSNPHDHNSYIRNRETKETVTVETNYEWFIPYLKYFCDYIDDMVEEHKQLVISREHERLKEKTRKLKCSSVRSRRWTCENKS